MATVNASSVISNQQQSTLNLEMNQENSYVLLQSLLLDPQLDLPEDSRDDLPILLSSTPWDNLPEVIQDTIMQLPPDSLRNLPKDVREAMLM
jgi:hypothetical protein